MRILASETEGSMSHASVAGKVRGARLGAMVPGFVFMFALAILLSWAAQRRLDAWLDALDTRTLDSSAKVFDDFVAQQSKQLTSTIAVLSEDARVRAMVLTPFDQATVVDLLTDLKKTSGASVVALLDSAGTVRAVVGAPEMSQLDLGTSSLVRSALEKPSAQLWAFGNEVGVLSATPVRLDNQVRALFMMGFHIEDALLENIERTLGATGAVFVGDSKVASASTESELEQPLRAAAELQPGTYQIVAESLLGMGSRVSESVAAARVGWLVPRQRDAEGVALMRALSWLPALLVGLLTAFVMGFWLTQSRADRR